MVEKTEPKKKKPLKNKMAKGARLERLAMKQLQEQGFYCIRSAGSKGVFDLVAFNDKEMFLIQVKANKPPGIEEMDRIFDAKVPENCRKMVFIYTDGKPKEAEIIFV